MPFASPGLPLGEARPSTFGDPGPTPKDDLRSTTQNGRTVRKSSPPMAFSRKGGRPIHTIIINNNALLRAGLAHILAETQFRVRTQCSSMEHLPQRALAGEQCLAVIGINHSDPGAVRSDISYLKSHSAEIHIVILGEQLRPAELLTVIEAGADAYLLMSEITAETLVRCLELVLVGGVIVPRGSFSLRETKAAFQPDASPLIESVSASTPVEEAAQSSELSRLSNREQTILRELMQGVSNKHVARSLGIAEATVKVHIKNLLRKLRVKNRTQAAMWATSHFHEVSDSVTPASGAMPNGGVEAFCQKGTRPAISVDKRAPAFGCLSLDATNQGIATTQGNSTHHNGESLTVQALPCLRDKDGDYRSGLTNVPITAPRLESLSPLVTEVVRYLRQQDDVVVPEGDGMFLVNGRFHLQTSELVDKANRIRQRQNQTLFN